MKKYVLAFILGGIVFSSISLFAYSYNAKDISFSPSNTNWKVSNVSSAIEDIKNNYHSLSDSTTFSANDLLLGKTAYDNNGNLIVGTLNNYQNVSFQSALQTKSIEVGFRPKYVSCIARQINNSNTVVAFIYNYDFDASNVYAGTVGGTYSKQALSVWIDINDNGFVWKPTSNNFNNSTILCSVSK